MSIKFVCTLTIGFKFSDYRSYYAEEILRIPNLGIVLKCIFQDVILIFGNYLTTKSLSMFNRNMNS